MVCAHLEIEMYDVVVVHVLHALADLPHEQDAVALRQAEVVGDHALEQLAAGDAEGGTREGGEK